MQFPEGGGLHAGLVGGGVGEGFEGLAGCNGFVEKVQFGEEGKGFEV